MCYWVGTGNGKEIGNEAINLLHGLRHLGIAGWPVTNSKRDGGSEVDHFSGAKVKQIL